VFNYAMDKDSNINAGAQPLTYITYYSGWPSNLEIRYVPENLQTKEGKATLVDYPRYVELTKYVQVKYPYLTEEQAEAAANAVKHYEDYLAGGAMPKTDEWDLINASLNPQIPIGVKAIQTGLFSGVIGVQDSDGNYKIESVSGKSPDLKIQSVTFADIEEYEPYTFSGCVDLTAINITGGTAKMDDYAFAYAFDVTTSGNDGTGSQSSLTTFNMQGGGGSIGNYAFCNNKDLIYVTISPEVSELGIRPFRACTSLQDVNFSGGPYFTTGQSIIYGLKDGNRDVLVECLESRGGLESSTPNAISPTEVAGITSIVEEAFMDCVDVTSADLTTTYISGVPENAFKNTRRLNDVELPTSCRYIRSGAFSDSYVSKVSIPDSVTNIAEAAFNTYTTPNSNGTCSRITFYCNEGSTAADYASERGHENIQREDWDGVDNTVYKVYFMDDEENIIDVQEVIVGHDATPPTPPAKEGKEFVRWLGSYTNIHADTTVYASYRNIDSDETKYLVEFFDYTSDEKPIQTYLVAPGEDAPAIIPPS
ncbi:MAG: leucine-rich repeat domain-containing protein, partial [Lachnospiraceae bacterium]|nr:leucine-rich repeat domain-containing protein [Lachnospiraceae bacterium]